MKNNTVLYILLVFLIVVNGFFLYNYIVQPNSNDNQGPKEPMRFLTNELNFNNTQLETLEIINTKHHQNMMHINDEIIGLKDALLNTISKDSVTKQEVDSITNLIGNKQVNVEKEIYYHLNSIHELCDEKQKEKFKKIIKDALRRGGEKGGRPPKTDRPEGHRPPPPNGF